MSTSFISILLLVAIVHCQHYNLSLLSEEKGGPAAAGTEGKIAFGYGSNSSGPSNRIEVYDVAGGYWTAYYYGAPSSDMVAAATDGVILFGGIFDSDDAYIFSNGTWIATKLSQSRVNLATGAAGTKIISTNWQKKLTQMPGQRILFGGGENTTMIFDTVDIFCTNNGSWIINSLPSGVGRKYLAACGAGELVLFGGGQNSSGLSSDLVDIYDTSTDTWVALEYLSVARWMLKAVGSSKYAIFAGGRTDTVNFVDNVDLYNIGTGIWSTTSLSIGRDRMGLVYANGYFFIAGGKNNSGWLDVIDIYDEQVDQWHLSALPKAEYLLGGASSGDIAILGGGVADTESNVTAIFSMADNCGERETAVASLNNLHFFAGGVGGGPDGLIYYSKVNIYDSDTGNWSVKGLSKPRAGLAAAATNGIAMFGGGHDIRGIQKPLGVVDIFNVSSGLWSETTLSIPRTYLAAAATSTKILFAGGYPTSDVVDIFNTETGVWLLSMTLSEPVKMLTGVASVTGDKVYFAGGSNGSKTYDTINVYDSESSTWSIKRLSQDRELISSAACGELIFFAGGRTNVSNASWVIDMLNETTGNISVLSLNVGRQRLSTVCAGDAIVFAGGEDSSFNLLSSIEVYYPKNITWNNDFSLSVAKHSLGGLSLGDRALFAYGYVGDGYTCSFDIISPPQLSSSSSSGSDSGSVSSSSSLLSSGGSSLPQPQSSSSSSTTGSSGGAGGCATSDVFAETKYEADLPKLRQFRDEVLLKSTAGRSFVSLYYGILSPSLLYLFDKSAMVKIGVRLVLIPFAMIIRGIF